MHDVQPTNTRYTGPKEKKKGQDREERSHKESLKKRSVDRHRERDGIRRMEEDHDLDGDRSVPPPSFGICEETKRMIPTNVAMRDTKTKWHGRHTNRVHGDTN